MNTKLLKKIAKKIERKPGKFNQGFFENSDPYTCDTTHCVGGWACAIVGLPATQDNAAFLLDLNHQDATTLFYTGFDLTAQEMAERLRKIARTGKVTPA